MIAAGLRTWYAYEKKVFAPDSYLYSAIAEDMSKGGIAYAYSVNSSGRPPLLPIVESFGSYVNLSPRITGILIGGILGSLTPLAVFLIVINIMDTAKNEPAAVKSKLSNKPEDNSRELETDSSNLLTTSSLALLGAFLVAIHPKLIIVSVIGIRECLYIPLFIFSITVGVIAIRRQSVWLWGIVGILAVLANMSRREGLEIIIIFLIWLAADIIIFFLKFRKKNFPVKKNVTYWLKLSAVFMITFWGLIIPIEKYLQSQNCTWGIFKQAVRGSNMVEKITDKK